MLHTLGSLVDAVSCKQVQRLQHKKHFDIFDRQSLELVNDSGLTELEERMDMLRTKLALGIGERSREEATT